MPATWQKTTGGLTHWAVFGINCSYSQELLLGKLYGDRLINRYYIGCQTRPLLEQQQTGEFAAVDSALGPVVVKAFVVIRVHVCEKESCSLWGSPVVYSNCSTSTLQNIAVRHDLQQAESALDPALTSGTTGTAGTARCRRARGRSDAHRKP